MNRFAIIVAGGSGSRMEQKTPKQFLILQGKPMLMHTIEKFLAVGSAINIVLVLPPKQMQMWHSLCNQHNFYPAIQTVNGGNSRFQSVKNGLKAIRAAEGLVAVHDGVRPMVETSCIEESYQIAAQHGTAVTSVALKDSARKINEDGTNEAIDRSQYRLIQTPQTFRLDLMRAAFEAEELPTFTDCAAVLEHSGQAITLIEGSYKNIKITTPEDLVIAESFFTIDNLKN